jgi:hypothetical protein
MIGAEDFAAAAAAGRVAGVASNGAGSVVGTRAVSSGAGPVLGGAMPGPLVSVRIGAAAGAVTVVVAAGVTGVADVGGVPEVGAVVDAVDARGITASGLLAGRESLADRAGVRSFLIDVVAVGDVVDVVLVGIAAVFGTIACADGDQT